MVCFHDVKKKKHSISKLIDIHVQKLLKEY